jgi:hypothetical protein
MRNENTVLYNNDKNSTQARTALRLGSAELQDKQEAAHSSIETRDGASSEVAIPLPVSNPCLFPDVSIGQNQVCTDICIL